MRATVAGACVNLTLAVSEVAAAQARAGGVTRVGVSECKNIWQAAGGVTRVAVRDLQPYLKAAP